LVFLFDFLEDSLFMLVRSFHLFLLVLLGQFYVCFKLLGLKLVFLLLFQLLHVLQDPFSIFLLVFLFFSLDFELFLLNLRGLF
jgi:hypothetical protein